MNTKRLVLCYDIANDRIRTKVFKYLSNYGTNVQKSVFELIVTDIEQRQIVSKLDDWLPFDENDSVRIYSICRSCTRHIFVVGYGIMIDNLEFAVV